MDQCQAETPGTRWSSTRPSPWARWCRPGPAPPAVWRSPASPPQGSPSAMGRGPREPSTPPTVTVGHPPPLNPPVPRVIMGVVTTIRGLSASVMEATGAVAMVMVSQEHRVELGRRPGGCYVITWGAGHPRPPPHLLLKGRATLSAPPQVRLITALSFLTPFPTRDQLVFQ